MKKMTALLLTAAMAVSAAAVPVSADEAKTVRVGVPYDPGTFDTAEINTDPATWLDNSFSEPLLRSNNGYEGGLAESWTVSEDGKTWTFTLRSGLTYSDGETAITTEDLEYTAKRLLDPAAGHYNAESAYIIQNAEQYYSGECSWEEVGVKVIDETTIEYTFKNPEYESTFTSPTLFGPLEEAFVEPLGVEYGSSADKTLYCGPFVISEWTLDSMIVLTKNENYWNKDAIHMDEMSFIVGATGDTGLDMMLAGELDFVPIGNAMQKQTLIDAGYDYFEYTGSYRCMNINLSGKTEESGLFLGNANFRKALSFAIDRTALTMSVMTGEAPANRLTAPSEAGVEGFFNDEFEYEGWPVSADPEKAQEYLNAALEELGKTIEEVPAIELLCYESQGSIDVLAAIQDMLKNNLGIETVINPQTIQVMISSAMTGDYDLWYGGNGLGIPDALSSFLSSYTTAMASALRGYSNEEFDALYDAALASPTMAERKANYFEVEKFFCENTLNLILGWTNSGYFHVDGYTNWQYDTDVDFTYLDIAE